MHQLLMVLLLEATMAEQLPAQVQWKTSTSTEHQIFLLVQMLQIQTSKQQDGLLLVTTLIWIMHAVMVTLAEYGQLLPLIVLEISLFRLAIIL